MNKPSIFFTFSLFFCFQFSLSDSTLPVDFILRPSCNSNLDCPHYRYSRCNSAKQCGRCLTTDDCTHLRSDAICLASAGADSTNYCSLPCSTPDNNIHCIGMRSYCRSGECRQCYNDNTCAAAKYPGIADAWCDQTSIPNYPACSSCPKTGCPGTSTCINLKCVDCTSNADCGGSTPYCDMKFTGNFCKACLEDNHCNPGSYCSSSGQCVECMENGHCSTGNCSPGNICVMCNDDTGCLDSTKPYCVNHVCMAPLYQPICSPNYNIQVQQINDQRQQFDINFPSQLALKIDIQNTLVLTLQSIPQSDYTYTLNKVSKTYYQAIFAIKMSIPATKLRLQLPCPSQIPIFYGDIILDIDTKIIPFTTPELQETIESIQNVATAANNVVAGASGSMILAGANPAIMWALINLLQAFYYMIFINVQYPVNVQAFFGLFTLGNLPFIPNPIEWFFPEIDGVDLQAPEKFLENDVDGLFLQTAGNMLLTWFLVFVGYAVSKVFLKFTRNMPKLLNKTASKTIEIFEWSGVLRTLITSYTQLSMAAFLQIRVLNFDRKLYGVSSLTGIAFIIFAFAFPPLMIFLIYKFSKSPKILKAKYSTLTEEFKYDEKKLTPLYFTAFFIIRRLALTLALVFLHDHPYVQVIVLIFNCLIWFGLLIKYSPYDNKLNNIVNIISEFLFVVIHILIFLFAYDDHKDWLSDQNRLDLGWAIIGCCAVVFCLTLIASFIDQYFALKNLIKAILKFMKARKTPQKVKRKRSPQISQVKFTQNSSITSRDQLENSMTVMPLVSLDKIAHNRRRIKVLRPSRKDNSCNPDQVTEL